MVEITDINQEDAHILRMYIQKHVELTGSEKGAYVLQHFQAMTSMFKKVLPVDFKNALASRKLDIASVLEDKNKVYQNIQIEVKK